MIGDLQGEYSNQQEQERQRQRIMPSIDFDIGVRNAPSMDFYPFISFEETSQPVPNGNNSIAHPLSASTEPRGRASIGSSASEGTTISNDSSVHNNDRRYMKKEASLQFSEFDPIQNTNSSHFSCDAFHTAPVEQFEPNLPSYNHFSNVQQMHPHAHPQLQSQLALQQTHMQHHQEESEIESLPMLSPVIQGQNCGFDSFVADLIEAEQKPPSLTACLPDADKFSKVYQRNNKKGGKKHLLCFPFCGPEHKESKQCKQSIRLAYTRELSEKEQRESVDKPAVLAFARFACVQDDLSTPDLKRNEAYDPVLDVLPGEELPVDLVFKYVKDSSDPLLPLFKGDLDEKGITIEERPGQPRTESGMFCFRERAWHYGWVGGRYRQGRDHLLRFYVFERHRGLNFDTLVCRSVVDSPSFRLYSSRFRYNVEKSAEKMLESKPGSTASNPTKKRKIAQLIAETKVIEISPAEIER